MYVYRQYKHLKDLVIKDKLEPFKTTTPTLYVIQNREHLKLNHIYNIMVDNDIQESFICLFQEFTQVVVATSLLGLDQL